MRIMALVQRMEPIHIATITAVVIDGTFIGPVQIKKGHPCGIKLCFAVNEMLIAADRAD